MSTYTCAVLWSLLLRVIGGAVGAPHEAVARVPILVWSRREVHLKGTREVSCRNSVAAVHDLFARCNKQLLLLLLHL